MRFVRRVTRRKTAAMSPQRMSEKIMQVIFRIADFGLASIRRLLAVEGWAAVVGSGFLAFSMASPPAMSAAVSTGEVVATQSGRVKGVVDGPVVKFLGIPYAAPPTGKLRWKPPQAPKPWHIVRDASQPGPACPQPPSFFGPASENEDCLYLNVYAPKDASGELPVIVWIHGGDFIAGQGSDYDGSALVQAGNVIIVSVNYRLGIFGFLAHPALDREASDHSSGNYGILDQQLALHWVQENIRAFGGDPHNVTVAGESAGGLSVLTHIASPTSAGLFQRAIVESGGFRLAWTTAQEARTAGRKIAKNLGCTTAVAKCLRAQSAAQLLVAQGPSTSLEALLQWGPNVSGALLPQQPLTAVFGGTFNRVPLLMGSNHDEGRLFVGVSFGQEGMQITADTYPDIVKSVFGGIAAPLVLAAYPLDAYANPDLAFATLFGDSGLSCQSYLIERILAKRAEVYVYEFADETAPMVFLPVYDFPYGATHTSELPYLFPEIEGYQYGLGKAVLDSDQQQLAATMRTLWTQFAKYGNPNRNDLPRWAPYDDSTDDVLSLVAPAPAMSRGFVSDHKCLLWSPLLGLSAALPPWLTGALE
jgi:para-nitrobenzyl esterase